MKKILFILLIIAGCSIKVCAQSEEHPTPTSIQTDKVLYLYNKTMRGFLVGGNNYNTQASLSSDHAYKVILRKYLDESGKWDGITYFITDSVELGDFRGAYRNLFIEYTGWLYVDQRELGATRDRDNLWTIELIAGKKDVYKITPSSLNKSNNFHGKQLGVMAMSAHNLPIVGIYDPIGADIDYEWCFITDESKKEYFEKKTKQTKSIRDYISNHVIDTKSIPDEEIVYMLNLDYEGFLVGANEYNTQASLSKTEASKVILHKYVSDDMEWDGKSYLITDLVKSGIYSGEFRNLYIDSDGVIWVDQRDNNAYMDCIWEIETSKDNPSVCFIRPSNKNHVFKSEYIPDYYLGAVDYKNFRELPTLNLVKNQDGNYCTWAFVTAEQWEHLKMEKMRDDLQKFIGWVKERFPNVDTTIAQQICNNPNSSSSEIYNQIGQMRLFLFSNNQNSYNNIDFTSLIENADFEGIGGKGWDMPYDVSGGSITWRGGSELNYCAEACQSVFDFYQDITGIPNGLYRIDVQAFYRTRGADLAWIERDTSFVVPEFYANNMSVPIHNLMHTTFPSYDGEYDFLQAEISESSNEPKWQCLDGTYALNNMRSAALAFSKGYFDQSLYCIVDSGTIRIGIRELQKKVGSWCVWDNFRLTYLAETTENYRDAVLCYLEKAKESERLATIKGINTKTLSGIIENTEKTLQSNEIQNLYDGIVQVNQAIKDIRRLSEEQEFGDNNNIEMIYAMNLYESDSQEKELWQKQQKAEQDSIAYILYEANSFCLMGMVMLEQNDSLAIKHFHKAFDLFAAVPSSNSNNNIAHCVSALASFYYNKGRYDDIIHILSEYTNSLQKRPWKEDIIAQIYYEIGNIYFLGKKDYYEAEQSYKKAIQVLEPRFDNSYLFADSKKKYQQILVNNLNQLSYSLAFQEKYEDAIESVNRAIELQPEEATLYDTKGEIFYRSGDIDNAKIMWEKIVNIDPAFANHNSQLYQFLYGKK